MSTLGGPRIVSDSSLKLHLDAADKNSFTSVATGWRDISGNGNHGSFTGTPVYSSERGSLVYDGSNMFVTVPNPLGQTATGQVWTVVSWINITTNTVTKPQYLVAGMNAGNMIEAWQGNNSIMYLNGGVNDYYTYGGQFTAQGWVMATFRFNNATGDRQILRNLTNISTGGPNNTFTPSGLTATFTIGNYVLGNLANIMIYNKYLNDAEVSQNFNAMRGRFGV
jgi:hypothetical protein